MNATTMPLGRIAPGKTRAHPEGYATPVFWSRGGGEREGEEAEARALLAADAFRHLIVLLDRKDDTIDALRPELGSQGEPDIADNGELEVSR